MKRMATAHWQGGLKDGKGDMSTKSVALQDKPFSFKTRFENESGEAGTNPEELIAAAHAGCFSMALCARMEQDGHKAEKVTTECTVSMDKDDTGPYVKSSHLKLKATVPGMDKATFDKLAKDAKENCPISRLLDCDIQLDAELQ